MYIKTKIYIITSDSNYGKVVQIVNAHDEDEAWEIASESPYCWYNGEVEEIDTDTYGLIYDTGPYT